MNNFKYEIALSFAGEDRKYVHEVATILKNHNVKVFYDAFEEVEMWGENLYDYLSDIYRNKARYTIVFISEHYSNKLWTNHERQSMQARAFEENKAYILPVRINNASVPSILSTVHYLHDKTPEDLAKLAIKKIHIGISRQELLQNELNVMDKRSLLEGLTSPTEWFINWQETINPPLLPPKHRLLHKVFIERDIYSVILDDYLRGGKSAGITGFLGMGGVGKTYMALKIAWELIDEHQWQVVWVGLLQQGTDEALEQIAKNFGLFFVHSLKTEEKVAAIRKLFQKVTGQYPKLLVVLDNAENFPRLDLLLEAFREVPILVTSRRTECADIIPYKKLDPLSGKDALQFCERLLNYFNIQVERSKHDNEDLVQLCKGLGGHPLGIRLALTGFVKKPLQERNKKHRFLQLLEDIKSKGLGELSTKTPQGDSLDEHQLHNNIASTFAWTYEELIVEDNDVYHKGAFFLLPIMSALGTTNVSVDLCKQGINYILKKIPDDSDKRNNNLNINYAKEGASNKTLELLSTDSQALEHSVSILIELALVELLDADKQIYALHPLIREFSFYHCDKYSFSGSLSSEIIFRMAIEIIGNEHGNEALLDLLPRLKKSRQLAELAINQVKKHHYHNLYYDASDNKWTYLDQLLDATYLLATEFSLKEDQIWILLQQGELKDRMEDKKGVLLMEEGIRLFIKKEREDKYETQPNTLFDWLILEKMHTKNNILWASIYLKLYRDGCNSQENAFHHTMQVIRLLPENRIYEKGRMIRDDIQNVLAINIIDNTPALLNSLNQKLASNIILDLTQWAQMLFSSLVGHEVIEKAEKLYNIAVINIDKFKNDCYVISPQHSFHFKATLFILSYEHSLINEAEFSKQINKLRHEILASGIRGYELEIQYCVALAKRQFENQNWQRTIELIEQAFLCLQEIPKNNRITHQAFLELLKLSTQTFLNNELTLLAEQLKSITNNEEEIIHALPLVYLAQACLYSAQGDHQSCSMAMAQCEKCFQQQTGAIPPFVRPLTNQWRNWSLSPRNILINDLLSWRVDYAMLPERVRSKRDGKIMRLIRPGIQWNKEGNENWLYPFYIDETPVNHSNAQAYFNGQDIHVIDNGGCENEIVSLSEIDVYEYSNWSNKKIPSKEELFAAWLQLEQAIKPEQWQTIEETSKGMLKRIENILLTGEPFSKDWKNQTLDKAQKQLLNADNSTAINKDNIEIQQLFSIPENIDAFYKGEWLTSNVILAKNYQKHFVDIIAKTPIAKEGQQWLSLLLATSFSLNAQEKARVLKAANEESGKSLSVFQCEELIKTWEEERKKFKELHKEHPGDIEKLLKKTVIEFLYLIKVSIINNASNWHSWFLYVSDPAHTDLWLSRDKQEPKINTWYVSIDEDTPEDIKPVLRCVVPIYTQRDLNSLEPL